MNKILIDRFTVPRIHKNIFFERVTLNRKLIHTFSGFIKDSIYVLEKEDVIQIVTVAVWSDEAKFFSAKEKVRKSYLEEGFDMPQFLKNLGITIDRGVYEELQTNE
ncbi:antibiotic biosynthesis monooxygenase [Leptospira sp. 96542]|nr:antibiotic biosynthesis monooxygenase [Leptospira sp. 96542]